tara:strand:- start:2290 stop:4581 length:2292 start_codon:yes stop_codon:yes gene_type:complete
MSYYVTSENSVLNINNAHLKVSGNIQTDVMKLGAIEFAPPASDVPGTVNFTNVTTGVTTSSNLNVGGTLMLGSVELVTATAALEQTVNLGNVTSNTVQFTNATTGIVATGNVEASKFIGDGSLLTGITTIESNVDLIRNTDNTAFINLNSNVVTEFPRSKKFVKYPRVALSTDAGNHSALGSGYTQDEYTVKVSSEMSNYKGTKVFTNTNLSTSDTWISAEYKYSSGNPVSVTTNVNKFGQNGEWLEIKLPNKIKLSSTKIFTRRQYITERIVKADIWASNTGTDGDWVKLTTINFNDSYTDTIPMVSDIYSLIYYRYFAIQITQIGTSISYANIGEWELFGVPEYDPDAHGTDVTVKSYPNVPNADWLEVYYDAKGLAVMPNPVPDETTNNRDGVVTGATLDTTGGIESFAFNGVNQTITLSDVGISGGQALSMSGWLKVNSAGEVARMGIGTYTAARCMYFTVDSSVGAYYIVCNAHNNVYTGTFTPNTWIHVNMVYTGATYLGGYISGATLLLYINGKLQTPSTPAAGTTPLNLPSPCPLRLGRGIDGGYKAGSIANFRLFNRALTSDEIYQLYAYQKEYFGHGDLSMTLKAGRLGIGTSEPRAMLDVRGDIMGGCPVLFRVNIQSPSNSTLTPTSGAPPIVWNNVSWNVGGGYNSSTGIFTAPIQGYYSFNHWAMTNGNANLVLIYKINNAYTNDLNPVRTEPFQKQSGYSHTQNSGTTTFKLRAGDTFYIALTSGNIFVSAVGSAMYNNFEGYYLSSW